MCCKSCQYCLESCYWHCFEKHFCYDEDIALYEDEDTIKNEKFEEKNNNLNIGIYDNLAFYDSVALIANRSIFQIEPLEEKQPVITTQPKSKLRWFEDYPPEKKKEEKTEEKNDERRAIFVIPEIHEDFSSPVPSEPSSNSSSDSTLDLIRPATLAVPSRSDLNIPTPVKYRKKSLHERRVSKSLTLDIKNIKYDIPLTRQSSFPKFYLETPERNQIDSSIFKSPVAALETPVMPQDKFKYDLKSIVQLEVARNKAAAEFAHGLNRETKFSQIKDKLKPLKLLRNASSNSLHAQQ